MPARNSLHYLLREARKAGVVLTNALVQSSKPKKKPRRPHRYVKGIHKGNFVKRKLPEQQPSEPTVPKLPPLGPQTMPQPLKQLPQENASSVLSATPAQQQQQQSSNYAHRIYEWWKQNAAVLVLNFGSICTLTGFTRSDVLELRTFSMTGSVSSVIYFLLTSPIRWAPIAWSSLFAAVNGWNIYKILYERNAEVILTEHQQDYFVEHFMPSGVTPKQFELIVRKATPQHYKQGDLIVKQGDVLNKVYLVVQGKTRAQYMGRRLTAVSSAPGHRQAKVGGDAGAWIGEMTFLEQFGLKQTPSLQKEARLTGRAIYTIVAASDCEVLEWSHDDIEALMKSSTDLRASMTRAMTAPIVGKVINFTVSMGNKGMWPTWLNDWKYSGDNTQVHVERKEEKEEDEMEELEPVM